ncbi:MAG: YceI family protein [Bacteroidota bacterium]|nr:YceI family protein [Bacteroidota bacterium]
MKKTLLIGLALFLFHGLKAQRYYTKTGIVTFHAGTTVEDIDGINKSTTSIFDVSTGEFDFALLVNGFEFRRALMQQHFNEDYLESDKYPKSTFKGKITNISSVNFSKDGTYPVQVKGTLTIHNISKEIEVPGTFIIKNGKVSGTSTFNVALADYNISIPSLVADKLSKTAKVVVNCDYSLLK